MRVRREIPNHCADWSYAYGHLLTLRRCGAVTVECTPTIRTAIREFVTDRIKDGTELVSVKRVERFLRKRKLIRQTLTGRHQVYKMIAEKLEEDDRLTLSQFESWWNKTGDSTNSFKKRIYRVIKN